MIDGIITSLLMAGIIYGLRILYLSAGCRCWRCRKNNPWWKLI